MRELTPAQLADDLRRLGVRAGGVLVVHLSYRAVRPVTGGPEGVVAALRDALGPDGTLVMPAWTDSDDEPFDPQRTRANPDLGVTADVFWRLPGVKRSAHPFAFAAIGPEADAIVADSLPIPPHRLESPIGRAYERDAQILLLGVGHDANTTIHLGEALARVPYAVPKHITVLENDRPKRIEYRENDHCCQRFALVDEWLRSAGLQRDGQVGPAPARLMWARDVVAAVREKLERDPLVFLHAADAHCEECEAARRSVLQDPSRSAEPAKSFRAL